MIQLFLEEHWRNIGSRRVFPKVAQEAVVSTATARGFCRVSFLGHALHFHRSQVPSERSRLMASAH